MSYIDISTFTIAYTSAVTMNLFTPLNTQRGYKSMYEWFFYHLMKLLKAT